MANQDPFVEVTKITMLPAGVPKDVVTLSVDDPKEMENIAEFAGRFESKYVDIRYIDTPLGEVPNSVIIYFGDLEDPNEMGFFEFQYSGRYQ